MGSERVSLGGLGRTNEFDDRLLVGAVVGRVVVCGAGNTNDVVAASFLVTVPVSGETEDVDVEPQSDIDGNRGTEALVAFDETGDASASKAGLVIPRPSDPLLETLVAKEIAGELGEEPFGLRLGAGSNS
jgi:hypothetical protein